MSIEGMAAQALAGEIVEAVVADEAHGACDISAGMFGTQFSALIRRLASDSLRSPVGAGGLTELEVKKLEWFRDRLVNVHGDSPNCDFIHSFNHMIERVRRLVTVPELPPGSQKYDDTLAPFVALMRAELHANADKGDRPGWLAMDTNTALFEIYYHMAKLTYAIRKEDGAGAREFAADVANMCMMLLDTTGLLGVPK